MSSRDPSYSQFREDKILDNIFLNKVGRCVEVGANDGITGSTTYYFEKKGWKCVLVEPVPKLCDRIRQFRSAFVFECAASSDSGEAVFYVAEAAESLSTFSLTAPLQKQIEEEKGKILEIRVRKRTLDGILDEVGISEIDFITIDVEGHELEVLRGFSLARHRPRIVIVEDNSDQADISIRSYMEQNGYKAFLRTGVNDWYAATNDMITSPGSIMRLEKEKKRYEFEDKIITKFSFLNDMIPDSMKVILRMMLRKFSMCVK